MLKIVSLLFVISLIGCGSKRDPQIELIQDMMKSPAVKPQDYDESKPRCFSYEVTGRGDCAKRTVYPPIDIIISKHLKMQRLK